MKAYTVKMVHPNPLNLSHTIHRWSPALASKVPSEHKIEIGTLRMPEEKKKEPSCWDCLRR